MKKYIRAAASVALTLACSQAFSYANGKMPGHFLFEAGGYSSTQGKAQNVYINGLIGDRFNVTNRNDTNTVFGFGYLFDGYDNGRFGISYGVNVLYLAKTKVSGTITQEFTYTNLAYNYYISHLPVYLTAKGHVNTNVKNIVVTADVGVGPNFMNTSLYADSSLDGITVPDNAYTGNNSTTTFSAMAGVGLQFNLYGQLPVEIGYRYFTLGEGTLNQRSPQILTQLKTGNNTAQALVLTFTI